MTRSTIPGSSRAAFLLGAFAAAALVTACAARGPAASTSAGARPAPLQQEIVSRLSGASDIRPGVTLANRTSIENRQETRSYLVAVLGRFGMEVKRQPYGTDGGENIYAVLPCGRPSAETVILGAHYDSARNSPGANDNATGVAVVAGVAEELSRVRKRTRDLIFVFFDEEERGLRGSRAFAQMLVDDQRRIHSVHTIDQMGWDADGDRAIELELPYEGAVDLYKKAAAVLKMSSPILVTAEAGSDHSAFRRLKFMAVGITEEYRNKDTTPHIHRPGDTVATVDFAYLGYTTRLVAEVMRMLTR